MAKYLIRTCFLTFALIVSVFGSVQLLRLPAAAVYVQAQQPQLQRTADLQRWQVCVRGNGQAELYSAQNVWMQSLVLTEGEALTMAMPPGTYYLLQTDGSRVEFQLEENASLQVSGGHGWTDGEILYLQDEPGYRLQVVCWLTQEEFESGEYQICWLTLRHGEVIRSAALHFVPEQAPEDNGYYCSSCSFRGLPAGTYQLERNGEIAANVKVSAQIPEYMVVLGGEK